MSSMQRRRGAGPAGAGEEGSGPGAAGDAETGGDVAVRGKYGTLPRQGTQRSPLAVPMALLLLLLAVALTLNTLYWKAGAGARARPPQLAKNQVPPYTPVSIDTAFLTSRLGRPTSPLRGESTCFREIDMRSNLLLNPSFDSGLAGWDASPRLRRRRKKDITPRQRALFRGHTSYRAALLPHALNSMTYWSKERRMLQIHGGMRDDVSVSQIVPIPDHRLRFKFSAFVNVSGSGADGDAAAAAPQSESDNVARQLVDLFRDEEDYVRHVAPSSPASLSSAHLHPLQVQFVPLDAHGQPVENGVDPRSSAPRPVVVPHRRSKPLEPHSSRATGSKAGAAPPFEPLSYVVGPWRDTPEVVAIKVVIHVRKHFSGTVRFDQLALRMKPSAVLRLSTVNDIGAQVFTPNMVTSRKAKIVADVTSVLPYNTSLRVAIHARCMRYSPRLHATEFIQELPPFGTARINMSVPSFPGLYHINGVVKQRTARLQFHSRWIRSFFNSFSHAQCWDPQLLSDFQMHIVVANTTALTLPPATSRLSDTFVSDSVAEVAEDGHICDRNPLRGSGARIMNGVWVGTTARQRAEIALKQQLPNGKRAADHDQAPIVDESMAWVPRNVEGCNRFATYGGTHHSPDILAAIGARWLRTMLRWSAVEPRRGEFLHDAASHVGKQIAAHAAVGIGTIVTVHDPPMWSLVGGASGAAAAAAATVATDAASNAIPDALLSSLLTQHGDDIGAVELLSQTPTPWPQAQLQPHSTWSAHASRVVRQYGQLAQHMRGRKAQAGAPTQLPTRSPMVVGPGLDAMHHLPRIRSLVMEGVGPHVDALGIHLSGTDGVYPLTRGLRDWIRGLRVMLYSHNIEAHTHELWLMDSTWTQDPGLPTKSSWGLTLELLGYDVKEIPRTRRPSHTNREKGGMSGTASDGHDNDRRKSQAAKSPPPLVWGSENAELDQAYALAQLYILCTVEGLDLCEWRGFADAYTSSYRAPAGAAFDIGTVGQPVGPVTTAMGQTVGSTAEGITEGSAGLFRSPFIPMQGSVPRLGAFVFAQLERLFGGAMLLYELDWLNPVGLSGFVIVDNIGIAHLAVVGNQRAAAPVDLFFPSTNADCLSVIDFFEHFRVCAKPISEVEPDFVFGADSATHVHHFTVQNGIMVLQNVGYDWLTGGPFLTVEFPEGPSVASADRVMPIRVTVANALLGKVAATDGGGESAGSAGMKGQEVAHGVLVVRHNGRRTVHALPRLTYGDVTVVEQELSPGHGERVVHGPQRVEVFLLAGGLDSDPDVLASRVEVFDVVPTAAQAKAAAAMHVDELACGDNLLLNAGFEMDAAHWTQEPSPSMLYSAPTSASLDGLQAWELWPAATPSRAMSRQLLQQRFSLPSAKRCGDGSDFLGSCGLIVSLWVSMAATVVPDTRLLVTLHACPTTDTRERDCTPVPGKHPEAGVLLSIAPMPTAFATTSNSAEAREVWRQASATVRREDIPDGTQAFVLGFGRSDEPPQPQRGPTRFQSDHARDRKGSQRLSWPDKETRKRAANQTKNTMHTTRTLSTNHQFFHQMAGSVRVDSVSVVRHPSCHGQGGVD